MLSCCTLCSMQLMLLKAEYLHNAFIYAIRHLTSLISSFCSHCCCITKNWICWHFTHNMKQTFCSIQLDRVWFCSHEQHQTVRRNASAQAQLSVQIMQTLVSLSWLNCSMLFEPFSLVSHKMHCIVLQD